MNYLILLFLLAASLTSLAAMSRWQLDREQAAQTSRINDLLPVLKPSSQLFVANFQDDLFNFYSNFPFNPINRNGSLQVTGLVEVGGTGAPHWRQDFAERAQKIWEQGGDVWITRRVLSPEPAANWNWVEGDDRRISWTELYGFFKSFDPGQSAGGDDGFFLLPPSQKNKDLLRQASGRSSPVFPAVPPPLRPVQTEFTAMLSR